MDNNEELESVQRDYVEEVCQLFRNNLAPKIIKEKLSDFWLIIYSVNEFDIFCRMWYNNATNWL